MRPMYRGDRPARATRRLHIYNSFCVLFLVVPLRFCFCFLFCFVSYLRVFVFVCFVVGGASHAGGVGLTSHCYIYIFFFRHLVGRT